MEKKDLNKSMYQAVMKALGSKKDHAHAAQHIVKDIVDPNQVAQTPADHIPVAKEGVLNKDASVSEIHQQKQAQAQASVGIPPKVPAMKKVGYGAMMVNEEDGMETPEKGVGKLRKFMDKCSMKKGQQHPAEKQGVSTIGSQVRTANFNKEHGFKEAANRGMSQAKDEAKNEVWRQKQMPKPKLPK